MFGHFRGSSIVSQLRKAFNRNSSIQSGSAFLAEINRTVSSLRPRGIVSASMSVVQPYLYSRFESISVVLIDFFLSAHYAALSAGSAFSESDADARQLFLRIQSTRPE